MTKRVVVARRRASRHGAVAAVLLLLTVVASGCATPLAVTQPDVDRFERVNRAVYGFNRRVDRRVVRPIARAYDRVMPPRVERHVRKFFENLAGPRDSVNNVLQGKFKHGFASLGRFLLNTTVGIGGFFDPATKIGLPRHAEDFGQTLAVWRVPSGGYLVVPLIGPGTVRDFGARGVDSALDPVRSVDDDGDRWRLRGWRLLSDRAALLPAERSLEEAFDEYAFVREAYWQRRRYQIFDDAPPEDEDYLFLDEEPADTPLPVGGERR